MSFSFPLAYLSFEGCYFFQAAKNFLIRLRVHVSIVTRYPLPSIVLLPKYPFGVGCKKRTRSKPRVPSSNPQVALFFSFPPSRLKLLLYIGGRGVQDGLKFEADSAKRRLSPSWKTVTRERRFFEKKFLTEVRFVREERM